ncbi:Os11g0484450 [Oryza sativa Japonica Group]|uniref:Os11g0484450 protein n=1 Tax=Oryza sativa subsp. japonica TaxID=39947 RepID=A0A0P0Y2K2_ORYSJ|nr:hypothetical protein EE612_055595 [Oryza sativa]BAT14062.1 Os11g0484450 [Oryza sativa Japonica Group]
MASPPPLEPLRPPHARPSTQTSTSHPVMLQSWAQQSQALLPAAPSTSRFPSSPSCQESCPPAHRRRCHQAGRPP